MHKRQSKNAAAVALGRLGGKARGKTVMDTIPPAKRKMYARNAAMARWAKVRAQKKTSDEA